MKEILPGFPVKLGMTKEVNVIPAKAGIHSFLLSLLKTFKLKQ